MFEVKSMTVAKGFTKNQQKYIAETIINEINENKNISAIVEIIKNQHKNDIKAAINLYNDDKPHVCNLYHDGKNDKEKYTLKIKLPDCNFKFEILNDLNNLITFLTKKIHVNVQLKNQVNNKIVELLQNSNGAIIKTKDNCITDGNILVNNGFYGEMSENQDIIENPNELINLLNFNCDTKLNYNDDFRKEENIIFNKNKHCIFYKGKNKNDEFIVINQKYWNIIKKIVKNDNFDVYYNPKALKTSQLVVKTKDTKEIIALIMPIFNDDLYRFENLPDIIEEKTEEENIIIQEEEEKLNKINSEFIKAEIEEEKEQKVVSAIDKIKSEYFDKKEKRNGFAELVKENKNNIECVKAYLKADNECEKAYKKYESALNKHINYVTGHEYSGNNLKTLNDFMKENNFKESAWLGAYQAKKAKLQLKKNAKPVTIQIFHENLDGTIFKMSENVYNIADFEPIQKIEESEDFKNIVEELREAV